MSTNIFLTSILYLACVSEKTGFVGAAPSSHKGIGSSITPFPFDILFRFRSPGSGFTLTEAPSERPSNEIDLVKSLDTPPSIELLDPSINEIRYNDMIPKEDSWNIGNSKTNKNCQYCSLDKLLTPPQLKLRIGAIGDLDKQSKVPEDHGAWRSYLKKGFLELKKNNDDGKYEISVGWDDTSPEDMVPIKSGLSYSGRGMELSLLNVYNGKLISCDDRTGVLYELVRNPDGNEFSPVPWVILADGNYTGPKGFKCEWATMKNGDMYVGGHGISLKQGDDMNNNAKFVKRISSDGRVTHMDWTDKFDKLAEALGISSPGYVVHEAVGWSEIFQRWMFLPRKISETKYSASEDFQRCSNTVLLVDDSFADIKVTTVGSLEVTHGFSSFKWVPGTNDEVVVALKTLEDPTVPEQRTYVMAFDMEGNVILPETEIAKRKYEGIEFI